MLFNLDYCLVVTVVYIGMDQSSITLPLRLVMSKRFY